SRWHFTHCALTTASPLRSVARSFALAGSTHLPPDWLTMYATARAISRSLIDGLPPCGGILRMPSSACCVRLVRPCFARGAQAFASPIFGAPLAPLAWQREQTACTTSLPLRSLPCASACGNAAVAARATAPASHLPPFLMCPPVP